MKHNLLTALLLPSLALALSACGGGSDEPAVFDSSSTAVATPTPSTTSDATLTQQLEKAQNELDAVNARLQTLFADLEKAKQSQSNSAATNSTTAGSDALKQKNDELTAQIDQINKAKKELESKIDTLTKAKDDADKTKSELQKQKSELEKQVAQKTDAAAQAKKELESQIDTLNTQKQALEKQIAEATTKNQTDTATLNTLKEQLQTKQNELTQKQKELENAQKALKDAQDQLKAQTPPPDDKEEPPVKVPVIPELNQVLSLDAAFANLKDKYKDPERGDYTGFVLNIDHSKKTAIGQVIEPTDSLEPSKGFKIKDVAITLLGDGDKDVALRDLTAADFPDGGFAGKGIVGSKYGTTSWDGFAQMRFGVYHTDNQSHLFVYGNPTQADKSKLSNKTFFGSAIIGSGGDYQQLPKSVRADVDGASTKVDIIIRAPDETLKFAGNIVPDANGYLTTFGGELKGNKVQGGFFGGNVVDMGGVFEVNKEGSKYQGQHGVFGASADSTLYRNHGYKIDKE